MTSIKANHLPIAATPNDNDSDLNSDDEFLCDQDEDDDLYVNEDDLHVNDGASSTVAVVGMLSPVEDPPPYTSVPMCIVCKKRPQYNAFGKSFPTCGFKCAGVLQNATGSSTTPPTYSPDISNTAGQSIPRSPTDGGRFLSNSIAPAIMPAARSKSDNGPPPFVTADATIPHLKEHLGGHPRTPRRPNDMTDRHNFPPRRNGGVPVTQSMPNTPPPPNRGPVILCVVCKTRPCYDTQYVTCGLTCAEKLCRGPPNPKNCDYCHRRPKVPGHNQCGDTCRNNAKLACLLCKSRPKYKRYHLCGKTCKRIAVKSTPLILEAPAGHATFEMVEKKFRSAWKYPGTPCPTVKRIYKIIENKSFLQPYDKYKKSVGNEVFRYHGTTRKCNLGSPGNTKLCPNTACALCSILRTSFKTSLANPSGAFGAGIYSSSASNKAYSYTGGGTGAMLLTKVILGNVRNVTGWNEVMSCPPGFNSVVFDRQNGALNETIVYSDDAIRPVFLVMF